MSKFISTLDLCDEREAWLAVVNHKRNLVSEVMTMSGLDVWMYGFVERSDKTAKPVTSIDFHPMVR